MDNKIQSAIDGLAEKVLVPAFENMQNQMNQTKDELSREINKRPTREEIQGKLDKMEARLHDDIVGDPVKHDKVLNQKTDKVANKLHDKDVFDIEDVKEVQKISPFAVSPTL